MRRFLIPGALSLVVATLMLPAHRAHAQGAADPGDLQGTLSIPFGDGNRVYTLAKSAKQLTKGIRVAGISLRCSNMVVRVSGELRGNCRVAGEIQGVRIQAAGPIRLSLSTQGNATRLKETIRLSGQASGFGQSAQFTATGSGSALVFDGDSVVDIDVRVRVCIQGTCVRETGFATIRLDPEDGLWTVRIDLRPKSNGRLRGTGVVELHRKRFKYKVKGRQDPATGLANVTLKARKSAKHNKIELTGLRAGGDTATASVSYRIFGQSRRDIPVSTPILADGQIVGSSDPTDDGTAGLPYEHDGPLDALGSTVLETLTEAVAASR